MSALVQSYSQSQARLKFVTTLGMGNFDCSIYTPHPEDAAFPEDQTLTCDDFQGLSKWHPGA